MDRSPYLFLNISSILQSTLTDWSQHVKIQYSQRKRSNKLEFYYAETQWYLKTYRTFAITKPSLVKILSWIQEPTTALSDKISIWLPDWTYINRGDWKRSWKEWNKVKFPLYPYLAFTHLTLWDPIIWFSQWNEFYNIFQKLTNLTFPPQQAVLSLNSKKSMRP